MSPPGRPARLTLERLDDRTLPTVNVGLNGTVLNITLDAAGDAVNVSGQDATGHTVAVSGTGFATVSYPNITAVNVTDTAAGGGAIQQATFTTAGGTATLALTGAITVIGVETVNVPAPISAAGGVAVTGATFVNLAGGSIGAGSAAINLATTTAVNGQITTDAAGTDLATTGAVSLTSGFIGSAAAPLRLAAGSLSANTAPANGFQYYVGSGTTTLTGVDAGTGTVHLAGGTFQPGNGTGVGDTSQLDVQAGATFDLNGTAETVDRLTGAGTVTSTAGPAALTVGTAFGTSTFDGLLTGPVQLLKASAGTLTLTGANTYTGGTVVRQGVLAWANAAALGSGVVQLGDAGTPAGMAPFLYGTVAATLPNDVKVAVASAVIGSDLTTPGVVSYGGTVTLALSSGTAFLKAGHLAGAANATAFLGRITGTGDVAAYSPDVAGGVVILANQTANPNDFVNSAGPANVFVYDDSVLQLNVSPTGQLPDASNLIFRNANSTLQLAAPAGGGPFGETVGGLASSVPGAGVIRAADNHPFTLRFGANGQTTSYTGSVTDGAGTISLQRLGAGGTTLGGTVTIGGSVAVQGGRLDITGTATAAGGFTVSGTAALPAILGGTGTVNSPVTVGGDGRLTPGAAANSGVLTVGGVTLQAGTPPASDGLLVIRLSGPAAGTGYDQLKVVGPVNLTGGSALSVAPVGLSPLAVGQSITIVDNDGTDPVAGTFRGLPEGASFTSFGFAFKVSYVGGDGNDVTLTRVTQADQAPPTTTLSTPGFTGTTPPNPYTFTETYTDPSGVDPSTVGTGNLTVTGPNGFTTTPTLVSAVPDGSGGIVATYSFTAPGGSWDAGDNGTYQVAAGTKQVTDNFGHALPVGFALGTITITIPGPVSPVGNRPLAVGGGENGSAVVYTTPGNGTYTLAATPAPFGGITANVRTATADVNGDTIPDLILVTGPGTPVRFAVIDGKDNATVLVGPTDPFGSNFTGGAFVAAGDFNGDGRAEWVITPDQGGGPNVVIYNLTGTGALSAPRAFFALSNPAFRGGARPAVGDVNKDGFADLAVAAGFLGGPNVEVHSGAAITAGDVTTLIGGNQFFAFPADADTLRNGVYVAIGDVDGDGYGDLIFGGGPGGGPRVTAFSGQRLTAGDILGANANPVANFFFGDSADRGGVRVGAKDADGDARSDVVVGSGEGVASKVRVYAGKTVQPSGEPAVLQDLDPFAKVLAGGVFVG